jgi:hypothetical protein
MLISGLNNLHRKHYGALRELEERRLGLNSAIVARTNDSMVSLSTDHPIFIGHFRHHGDHVVPVPFKEKRK